MSTLVERVQRTIRRHELLPAGCRVVVAVSGGADSVALLHLLRHAAPGSGFEVAGVAHVNHQLRADASDADERFCRALAAEVRLPAWTEQIDVRAQARVEKRSVEATARCARYAALERARQALGADRVAVGHTADDQAETVLLKLVRGAGPRGIAGIYPRARHVVRPLLEVGRAEVRRWLGGQGLPHVEDVSNQDESNPRNYLRHSLLPGLVARFGAGVVDALARAAEVSRGDELLLADLTRQATADAVQARPGGIHLAPEAVQALPLALRRRVIQAALRDAGAREPGFHAVEVLRELVEGHGTSLTMTGGIRADRIDAAVVLSSRSVRSDARPEPFWYPLPVPGTVWVGEAGTFVEAELVSSPPGADTGNEHCAFVSAVRVAAGLAVRSWRAGDALRPVGLGGRKKVQDLFVDRKVPRAERHRIPLVVDAQDRVLWVPGHALDEACRAAADGGDVVVLKLTPQRGGP